DDGRDALGVAHGEPEAGRRAVVEDIDRIPIKADDLGKPIDHPRNVVKRVVEFVPRRHIGLTEPGKVWGDDMKPVSEKRDQVAEHVARAREAMQQQELGRIRSPRLTIENLETVDVGRAIADGRHLTLLYV